MTAVPVTHLRPAAVAIAGVDANVAYALARLIALDASIRELRVGDFLNAIGSMSPEHARHLHPVPAPGAVAKKRDMRELLSRRELEVVRLVAEGLSNKEISTRLSLSDKTVKNHISHILAKLALTARTQVAIMALRAGVA